MLTSGQQLASPLVARRQRDAPICEDRRLLHDKFHAGATRLMELYLLCFSVGFASLPWFVATRQAAAAVDYFSLIQRAQRRVSSALCPMDVRKLVGIR